MSKVETTEVLVERVRDALVNYGTWRMQKPRREKALAALDSLTAALERAEARVAKLTARNQFLSTEQIRADVAEARVAEVTEERDECEERYDELLSQVGGVSPG